MALGHRLPAIFTALFSSAGVLLAAFSGASCNFLVRITDEEDLIGEPIAISNTFGVLCEHEIFPRDGDKMWELSRIFLIVGLSLGSLTAAMAWAVASFLTPTGKNWNGISILAALTAVLQVPIFVLFEAEPCLGDLEDISMFTGTNTGMGCKLGPGSYMLVVSDVLFIIVTIVTQCFDPPRWSLEMDMWKVHKKGESNNRRPLSKKGVRNDEYYYDDKENYDDAMALTSRRARSAGNSEEENDNDLDSMSRILPAGKAKQLKNNPESETEKPKQPIGFFAKLFRSSSNAVDNLEVPAGETKSTSGDEEYDYENQLLHELEIVRVLPPDDDPRSTTSPRTSSVSGEGQEVSFDAYSEILKDVENSYDAVLNSENNATKDRSFQSFEPVVDDGTTLIPWMPSASSTGNEIASIAVVEQHQMIDSPSASLLCGENFQPDDPSVNYILQDLQCEELVVSTPYQCKPDTQESAPTTTITASPSGQIVKEVRNVAKKPSLKSSFRNLNIFNKQKGGYAQMSSDQSSDEVGHDTNGDDSSEDNYFNYYNDSDAKPPPGLQLLVSQEVDEPGAAVNESAASTNVGIKEDEIKDIYDDLDKSDEENSLLQSTQNSDTNDIKTATPFDCASIGSTHSDPGPISFASFEENTEFTSAFTSGESEQSTQITNISTIQSEEDSAWNSGGFSSESSSLPHSTDDEEDDYQEPSRFRRNDDVGSIKSHCSLLHMTIDEETEEDVKNELDPTYSLKRTLSTPNLRSAGPISTRKDKSTTELLRKLERLKRSIHIDGDNTTITTRSDLPPLTPQKAIHLSHLEDTSIVDSVIDDEILRPNLYDGMNADIANSDTIPGNLEMSNSEEFISPMKDTPRKENWRELLANVRVTPTNEILKKHISTPNTMDMSDELSETDRTRSTISYESDDSSEGGDETGPKRIRSKSMSRVKKSKKKQIYRVSNSLSPTTRRKTFSEGSSNSCLRPANISSSLARESRIRRLQQLRKGYVPLKNEYQYRSQSPEPYRRDPYHDPSSDSELTPKRKTAIWNEKDEIMSAASSDRSSDLPDHLYQPSLLESADEPCPEFDNILTQLDLQLIDLNRPIEGEYGADELSL